MDGSLKPTSDAFTLTISGDVTIKNGAILGINTWTGSSTLGSLTIESGGLFRATSGITTITNESDTGYAFKHDGIITANSGTFNITTPSTTLFDANGSTNNLYNLVIASGNTVEWNETATIDNDLTIDSGTFVAHTDSLDYTVTGDVTINSQLGNGTESGTLTFGSLIINSGGTYSATSGRTNITGVSSSGEAVTDGGVGTFTHNSGDLVISSGADANVSVTNSNINNILIESTNTIYWEGNHRFTGNLHINSSGSFVPHSATDTLEVDGELEINEGGTFGKTSATADHIFGTIDLNTGTYIATSGDTTAQNTVAVNNPSGDFQHNNGRFVVNGTGARYYGLSNVTNAFYNIEIPTGKKINLDNGHMAVINELQGAGTLHLYYSAEVLLGNITQSGLMNISIATMATNYPNKLYGVSNRYPVIMAKDIAFVDTPNGQNNEFGNLDFATYDIAFTTLGTGTEHDVNLVGDMLLDDLTIGSTTNFDIDGYRVEADGLITSSGVIDFGTEGLLFADDLDIDGTATGTPNAIVLTGANDFEANAAGLTAGVRMINIGDSNSAAMMSAFTDTANNATFIVGSGLLNTEYSGTARSLMGANITIANGGTLNASSSTITVSEDWKATGGLIGRHALDFDGSSEYVEMPTVHNPAGNFSAAVWFKTDDIDGARRLFWSMEFATTKGWSFINTNTVAGRFGFSLMDDSSNSVTVNTISIADLNDSRWHYAVATYENATDGLKLYVDGRIIDTADTTGLTGSFTSSDNLTIGHVYVNRYWKGEVGSAAIWNEALSESDIRTNMFTDCAGMSQSNIWGCWQFDEGTGTTIADSIGSNDGIASASSIWAASGTFTEGTSYVNMTGTGDQTIYAGGNSFVDLEVANSGATGVYLNDSITISGNVTITDGALYGQTADHSFGSLTINSGGTYDATSGTTTITKDIDNFYNNAGTMTHNNGMFHFKGPSNQAFTTGSSNFYNLNITSAISTSQYMSLKNGNSLNVDNDLNVRYGQLIQDHDGTTTLTVTGDVVVEGSGTLGWYRSGQTDAVSFGSLTINSGGTYTATSGTTTITSETSSGYAFDNDGIFTDNDGRINITTSADTLIDVEGTSGNLHNLSIALGATNTAILTTNLSVSDELTIESGALDTNSTDNYNLSIAGDVIIYSSSNITGQASDIAFGALTINSGGTYEATSGTTTITGESASTTFAIYSLGTFNHNNGYVNFTTSEDTEVSSLTYYNLELNSGHYDFRNTTVEGNLTLASGTYDTNNAATDDLIVNGDVVVNSGTLFESGDSASHSFDSLTMTGGTLNAPSGTIKITGEADDGDAWDTISGTFNAGTGTVNISSGTTTAIKTSNSKPFYNLIIEGNSLVYLSSTAIFTHVANDLYVYDSFTHSSSSGGIHALGDVVIGSGGNLNSAARSGNHTLGSLTIQSGGTYTETSGITLINGDFSNAGTYTHRGGITQFGGADGSVTATDFINETIVSGNVTFNTAVNYSTINVSSTGNLTINVSITNNGTYYYKETGGYASITGSSDLVSTYSYLNDALLTSNSPNAANFIDDVEAGSSWTVSGWDAVTPEISANEPEDHYNSTSQNMTFNFTTIDDIAELLVCTLYIDSASESANATTLNNTLTNIAGTDISEGFHTWNVNCSDGGNINTTAIRNFTVDSTSPNVTGVVYSPSSVDDLDPGDNILFNATVADDLFDVDTVILQYHNGTDWANSTMTNTGSAYNTTITLVDENATYTYSIFANDTLGNAAKATNQTFTAEFECSWEATSALGTTVGWNENKYLGNITINNTGDAGYSNNNCSLDIRLTYDASEGRIYYKFNTTDWEYIKNLEYTTIPAGERQEIEINATFLSEVAEEDIVITLDEFRDRSNVSDINVSANLITNQEGPYLLQEITAPSDSTILYLTDQDIITTGRTRNIMGTIPANDTNTAYNVTINWTIPSKFTLNSGNESISYENLSNSSWSVNELNITFADLASMTPGSNDFTLISQGFNETGDVILDLNNQTYINESVSVTFLCYNTSDGTCVTSCGYLLDSDCSQATASSGSSSSGGGGSGGGGGGGSTTTRTYAKYDLVRNTNQSFVMYYNNTNNLSIYRLEIDVEGFNADYIRVSPTQITNIEYGEVVPITTYIQAPKYFNRGEHNLTYTLTIYREGSENSLLITREIRYVTLTIFEISEEDAKVYLKDSENAIEEMVEANYSTKYVNILFKQANTYFEDRNYLEVKEITTDIIELRDIAFDVDNSIEDSEMHITSAFYWGLETPKSRRLINLAKAAFERGEFILAAARVKEAELMIALETKGEINYLYYTWHNWKQILIVSIISLSIFIFLFLEFKKYMINEKLSKLTKEEQTLLGLMKQVQNECFVQKKISMGEYMEAMAHYEKKLSNDIQDIIGLHSARSNLFKLDRIGQMREELTKLADLLKETQSQYMESGKIQTKVYQQKMRSITKRITAVEEKLTVSEAETEIRRRTNSMFRFWAYLQNKTGFKFKKTKKQKETEIKVDLPIEKIKFHTKAYTGSSKFSNKIKNLTNLKRLKHKFKFHKLAMPQIPEVKIKFNKPKFKTPKFLALFRLKKKKLKKRKDKFVIKRKKIKKKKFKFPKISLSKFKLPRFHAKKKSKKKSKFLKLKLPKLKLPKFKPKTSRTSRKFAWLTVSKKPKKKTIKKSQKKFKFPKISLPKIVLPKLPKIKLPKLKKKKHKRIQKKKSKIPKPKKKFSFPKIKLPKFKLPKIQAPKIKLPKLKRPKLNLKPKHIHVHPKTYHINKLHIGKRRNIIKHIVYMQADKIKLKRYIKRQLKLNHSKDIIRKILLDMGWNENIVKKTLNKIDKHVARSYKIRRNKTGQHFNSTKGFLGEGGD